LTTASEDLTKALDTKMQLHQGRSALAFNHGVFLELTYRANFSKKKKGRKKKNRGGRWNDHMNVRCFTRAVRTVESELVGMFFVF